MRPLWLLALVVAAVVQTVEAADITLEPIVSGTKAEVVDKNFQLLAKAVNELQKSVVMVGQLKVIEVTGSNLHVGQVFAPVASKVLQLPTGFWSILLVGNATVSSTSTSPGTALKLRVAGNDDSVEWGKVAGSSPRLYLKDGIRGGDHMVEVLGKCEVNPAGPCLGTVPAIHVLVVAWPSPSPK